MPLTFAHPVAVLPLKRSALPLSALVVGAVAPDLEFLFHLKAQSDIGHSLPGLFVFCMPVGLVFLWLLHRVWKRSAAALLGIGGNDGTSSFAAPFAFWPLGRLALLCAAVLIGSLTHVGWDSFTHWSGWIVQRVPTLRAQVFDTSIGPIRVYKILQHGSTAIGLTVLAWMALRDRGWIKRISGTSWGILAIMACTSIAAGIAIAFLRTGSPVDFPAARRLTSTSVVAISAVILAEVTLASIVWRLGKKPLFERQPPISTD